MAFTYNGDIVTDRNYLRLRIGDVDTNEQYLSDEAIDSIISSHPNSTRAAIQCVLAIMGLLARRVDRSAAGINSSRSQKFQHYRDLLAELRLELRSGNIQAYAGGMDKSRITTMHNDSSYPQQPFKVGMDDHR